MTAIERINDDFRGVTEWFSEVFKDAFGESKRQQDWAATIERWAAKRKEYDIKTENTKAARLYIQPKPETMT